MKKDRKQGARSKLTIVKYVRVALAGIVFALIATAILSIRMNTEARNARAVSSRNSNVPAKPSPEGTPVSNMPVQTAAARISVNFGEKRDMRVATGVDSFVLVSPEIATVEIKNRFLLTITSIKRGETILLIRFGQSRQTFVIEVISPPAGPARPNALAAENRAKNASASGSSTTMFSPGLGGGQSVLRQSLDYRQKLANDLTLRVAGEMFKIFGNTDRSLALTRIQNFSTNRLSVGLDTSTRSIDILDSQVDISPLSLNNFTIRGLHLVQKPKTDPKKNLRAKGLEVYAGIARPSLGFFDTKGGKIAGAMIPLITTDNFQARAGFIAISAEKNNRQARGGVVFQSDAAYAPTKEIFADAEMSLANGGLSWRARLDLNYAKYGASGEITRFSLDSPLNSIGVQYGGRKSESLSFYWRPDRHLSTSAGYNHTNVSRLSGSYLADFERSRLFANASVAITKAFRLNLRYSDQKIDTAFPGGKSKFAIQTRTISLGNSLRLGPLWSNTIEGRINFNREANADAPLEQGFSLNEQLRFGWHGGSLTGFLNYNRKSPSLTSMIVQNPGLLPPTLQAAFAINPAEFLRLNRDRIAYLLGGVELPETRSVDAGIRLQKAISRLDISGEVRYNAGEIYAINQKALYTSVSVGVRLDNANSVQVNGWKAIGGGGQSGITVFYTNQFGASHDGFQFSKLLGLNRGKVRGRVYFDLNGNGQFDVNEPGLAAMTIRIDDKRNVITDKDGRYELSANEGRHSVVLISEKLGVVLLASTPTEQNVEVDGRHKLDLNFGVRDHGSISGRVVNYLGPSPESQTRNLPGVGGVKITLRSAEGTSGSFVTEKLTSADGTYLFSNLRPGSYLIEINTASLPANYNIPPITGTTVVVEALHTSYNDISVVAQRAVAGIVFIDKDGDDRYTSGVDVPVEGAVVSVNDRRAITDVTGAYILRNLPAGRTKLTVVSLVAVGNSAFDLNLGPEAVTQRAFNLNIGSK